MSKIEEPVSSAASAGAEDAQARALYAAGAEEPAGEASPKQPEEELQVEGGTDRAEDTRAGEAAAEAEKAGGEADAEKNSQAGEEDQTETGEAEEAGETAGEGDTAEEDENNEAAGEDAKAELFEEDEVYEKEPCGLLQRFLHGTLKWLALVLVLVIGIVAGVLAYFYRTTTVEDLPLCEASFAGQSLQATAYEWFVPVSGRHLGRTFTRQSGTTMPLTETVTSQPKLEIPAEMQGFLTVTDQQENEVFSGTAAEFDRFAFVADGPYSVHLVLSSQHELGQDDALPTGSYTYDFTFNLHCTPKMEISTRIAMQGNVVGVRLTGILGSIPPSIQCELARDAVFTPHGGDWVCYLPVDYNQPGGDYEITASSGGVTVSDTVQVVGSRRRELDTFTADGSAAIPYFGAPPKKVAELFQIADPDVYWQGAFTQPVSGRVVRDYGVMEYTDRIVDPVLLAVQPELAALNELIMPRASVNVTMAVRPGRDVLAPAAGRVVFSGTTEAGRTIVIEHGCALKSIIYLLGSRKVAEGDYVAQGDVIGTTQGHVCCEMRLYDVPISPWEVWRGHGGLFF